MKRNAYIAFIALAICACNNDKEEIHNDFSAAPIVYHVSVKASFDSQTKGVTFGADGKTITSQFEAGDKIYVYNETKNAFARFADGDQNLAYLQPESASISADGSSCTLEGDLSFYTWNDESDAWEKVTVEAGDSYSLYYQMNEPDFKFMYKYIPRFNYEDQDGSAATASKYDFAEATGITMTLSGSTLTVPNAIQFKNLQSMFRQNLSFTKDDATVTPTISKLTVGTKNETLLFYYGPNFADGDPFQAFDAFEIYDPQITDGDIYLSLSFYYTEDYPANGDQLIFTAVDNEGNVYQCAKNVPEGGFKNSNYYYGTCELVWQYKEDDAVKPIVTRSDGGDEDELDLDGEGVYWITGVDGNARITISGSSVGYCFAFGNGVTENVVTLDGDGIAIYSGDDSEFIYARNDLTIELASDYTINCSNYDACIRSMGNLKLKTSGDQPHTLTVTTNDEDSAYGIYGKDNYDAWRYYDLANLAAYGFSVTCPGAVDNEDGTYTWVYTVTPVEE